MDRFSEIYNEILNNLNTCNTQWLNLKNSLYHTDSKDKKRLEELSSQLVECEERWYTAQRLYERFEDERDLIEKMLEGFCYFTHSCERSFVYPYIYSYFCSEGINRTWIVEGKTFYDPDMAIDYAKSFGIRKDWKDKVYQYLGGKING